jgi:predicted transcriptional regulator
MKNSEKNIFYGRTLNRMLHSLDFIALKRRALGLTQTQLADLAGVSQSYIAKLEAKKIEPSYNKVKAILEALAELEQGRETRVSEIMSTGVVSVQRDDPVQEAAKIMGAMGFSQLPVLDGERPVGSITERTIIERMIGSGREEHLAERPVSNIMDDPMPQVGEDAPVSLVANMLRVYPAVLVHRKDIITGIVTKADLLKTLT